MCVPPPHACTHTNKCNRCLNIRMHRLLLCTQGLNTARSVTMVELEGLGLDNQRSKVFVNALCKLNKAQMQGSSRFLCLS